MCGTYNKKTLSLNTSILRTNVCHCDIKTNKKIELIYYIAVINYAKKQMQQSGLNPIKC